MQIDQQKTAFTEHKSKQDECNDVVSSNQGRLQEKIVVLQKDTDKVSNFVA